MSNAVQNLCLPSVSLPYGPKKKIYFFVCFFLNLHDLDTGLLLPTSFNVYKWTWGGKVTQLLTGTAAKSKKRKLQWTRAQCWIRHSYLYSLFTVLRNGSYWACDLKCLCPGLLLCHNRGIILLATCAQISEASQMINSIANKDRENRWGIFAAELQGDGDSNVHMLTN